MERGRIEGHRALWALISLLLLAALACAQAGEVLTPEEATARALAPDEEDLDDLEVEEGIQIGEEATLTGRGFLINLLNEPGGRIAANQERGAVVTVLGIRDVEGEVWYRVEAATGTGWVTVDNLEPIGGAAEEEEEDDEIGAGDTVFLTSTGFLVNLRDEPGTDRIAAVQERGVQVEILDVTEVDGELWFRIDAPTGEGWVPAENITSEAP